MEALRRAILYRNQGRTASKRNAVAAKPQSSSPNTRRVQRVGGRKERSRRTYAKIKWHIVNGVHDGYCKEFRSLKKIIWLALGASYTKFEGNNFSAGQFGL
jgi:hypothetical protein